MNIMNNVGSDINTLISDSNKMKNDITSMKSDISKILSMVTELKSQNQCSCNTKGQKQKDTTPTSVKAPSALNNPEFDLSIKAVGSDSPKSYAAAAKIPGAIPKKHTHANNVTTEEKVKNDTAPHPKSSVDSTTPQKSNPAPHTQKSESPSAKQHGRDSTPKLPPQTLRVILSDSMTRDVNSAELDPSGLTVVKTFGGFTISGLNSKLSQFPKSNRVEHVLTHIGINDCNSSGPPMVKTNTSRLILSLKLKFPQAKLTFSATLPTKHGYTEQIKAINKSISEVCEAKDVEFVDYGSEFDGVKEAYSPVEGDHIHLSSKGSEMLKSKFQKCLRLTPKPVHSEKEDEPAAAEPGQPIPTVVGNREGENVKKEDFNPEKLVSIDPETIREKDVFQAFGAPCSNGIETRDIIDDIFKRFPNTRSATSVMKVITYEKNGVTKYRLDSDGEKGASERIKLMMEKTGMKNCMVVITRHFGQHISLLRWTVIQNQFTKIAEKLGYKVPSMNINSMYPPKYSSSYQRAPRYPRNNPPVKPLLSWPYNKVQHPPTSPYYPQQQGYSMSHYLSGPGPLIGTSLQAHHGFDQPNWNSYNTWNNRGYT